LKHVVINEGSFLRRSGPGAGGGGRETWGSDRIKSIACEVVKTSIDECKVVCLLILDVLLNVHRAKSDEIGYHRKLINEGFLNLVLQDELMIVKIINVIDVQVDTLVLIGDLLPMESLSITFGDDHLFNRLI
jgi:hypothetical protein